MPFACRPEPALWHQSNGDVTSLATRRVGDDQVRIAFPTNATLAIGATERVRLRARVG